MKLELDKDFTIVLKEVFNSVVFVIAEGNRLAVCMRDSGFEIGVGDSINKDEYTWYSVGNGCVEPLGSVSMGTTERLNREEFATGFAPHIPEPLAELNYVPDPKISAMLNDPNGGFKDKTKYPVPEDFVCPETPATGSRWEIDRDYDPSMGPRNAYTVLFVTNLEHMSSKYPPQVVYRGDNGRVWSRPLGKWPGSLRRLPTPEAVDGCDPAFMASLERGDHLRSRGLTEDQVEKALELSRSIPFQFSDAKVRPLMSTNSPLSKCPKCGAIEVESQSPRTKYDCGSTDYDQRPGSFIQTVKCRELQP